MKKIHFVLTCYLLSFSAYGAEGGSESSASSSPASSRVRTKSIAANFEGLPIMGGVTSPRSAPIPRRGSAAPLPSGYSAESSSVDVPVGSIQSRREKLETDLKLRTLGQQDVSSKKGKKSSPERYSTSPESAHLLTPLSQLPQEDPSSSSKRRASNPEVEEKEEKKEVPLEDIAKYNPGMPKWEDLVDISGLNLEKVMVRYDMFVPLKLKSGITYDTRHDVTLDIINLQRFKHRIFERASQQKLIIPTFDKSIKKAQSIKNDIFAGTQVRKDAKRILKELKHELPIEERKLIDIYDKDAIAASIEDNITNILQVLGRFGLTREHLEALEAEKPSSVFEKQKSSPETSDQEVSDEDKSEQESKSDSPPPVQAPISSPELLPSESPISSEIPSVASAISKLPKSLITKVNFAIDEFRKHTQKDQKREITRQEAEDKIRGFFPREQDDEIQVLLENYLLENEGLQFLEQESKDLKKKKK